MAQPSSTAPDEEMRSLLSKPRRFVWFFRPIAPLLLCALCSVSLGVFAYMQSSLYPRSPSTVEHYFPHLQAPGVRTLSAPELEKNGYYLRVITTLPATGPGRAARILLSARSEHENALYSIDTDGRNLQRLPETLPCDTDFAFTPDAHELICRNSVYPFDPITLRVTGEKALSDPAFGLAIWGSDSHQFVTATLVGADKDVSFYHADATYSSIARTAILLFNNVPMPLGLMSWSPDGSYLLFRGPALDGSFRDQLLLLPLATIQKRLLVPTSAPWSPGIPAMQVQPEDFVSIVMSKKTQTYSATWRPGGSSLTVIGGDVDDIDPQHVLTTVSVPTGDASLLVSCSNWKPYEFSYLGYVVWAPDGRLVFSLTTYSCVDNCRPIHINPGNNLYVYTPPNQA